MERHPGPSEQQFNAEPTLRGRVHHVVDELRHRWDAAQARIKPYSEVVLDFTFGPKPSRNVGKELLPREAVIQELSEQHPLPDILPKATNGAGRLQFNNGNPHDPRFNFDSPACRIDYALIWFHGQGALKEISEFAYVTPEEIRSRTDIANMYQIEVTEKNEKMLVAKPLSEYLKVCREVYWFPYQALLLSPDIDAFKTLESNRIFEERKVYIDQQMEQDADFINKYLRSINATSS